MEVKSYIHQIAIFIYITGYHESQQLLLQVQMAQNEVWIYQQMVDIYLLVLTQPTLYLETQILEIYFYMIYKAALSRILVLEGMTIQLIVLFHLDEIILLL